MCFFIVFDDDDVIGGVAVSAVVVVIDLLSHFCPLSPPRNSIKALNR